MANVLILKFPYSSTYGGGEKHTITLVEHSRHTFFLASSCSVLLPEFAKRNWSAKKRWGGTEPVTLKAIAWLCVTWPIVLLNLLRITWQAKRKHNIEVLYCLSLTEKVLLTPFAYAMGLRVIWLEHTQIGRWLTHNPFRLLYVLWSRFATVVAVAYIVKDQLIELGVAKESIRVVYNSADTDTIPLLPENATSVSEQFSVTYIGRLAKEKGLSHLLEAVALAKRTLPQLTLTIVGDGPERDNVEERIVSEGITDAVTLAGFQSNTIPWLEKAHVLVLPSLKETFGMVVAEALAAGRPVIATNVGDVPYVVGGFGKIVPPANAEALAAAIIESANNYDSLRKQSAEARQHVLDEFQQTRMITEYDDLISELA